MNEKQKAAAVRFGRFRGRVSDVDIRLLRVFQRIVECGGISQAQVDLGIGRSTISKHLSDLEQRLGMRLCERGRSGFTINDDGLQVYRASLELFAALEGFATKVNAVHDDQLGTLCLGVVDTTATDKNSPLALTILRFKDQVPRVRINLTVGPPNEVEKGVLEDTLHVAVLPSYHRHSSLRYHKLYDEQVALYCGKGHPLCTESERALSWEEITTMDFVSGTYAEPTNIRELKAQFRATASTPSTEGNALLILSGRFTGFLPVHYAQNWVAAGEMSKVQHDLAQFSTPFVAITRRGKSLPRFVKTFMELLLEVSTPN